jgi:ABC-type transporter Mla MlaB component
VLRITRSVEDAYSVTLKLEGKITDDWVRLLEHECRALISQKQKVRLDCANVSYVDLNGVEMLRKLPIEDVSIVNAPQFIIHPLRMRGFP